MYTNNYIFEHKPLTNYFTPANPPVDFGSKIFECGQTYVALSRVRDLEGLYLSSFDPYKIKVNCKVQDFYEKAELITDK